MIFNEDLNLAFAFNQGCDARLAGFPLIFNPYDFKAEPTIYNSWRRGWQDVDLYWGTKSKREYRPLTPILGE